jgi:hypothetical protein
VTGVHQQDQGGAETTLNIRAANGHRRGLEEVRAWQPHPLDAVYPILYLDTVQVKVKSQGRVINKAMNQHLATLIALIQNQRLLGSAPVRKVIMVGGDPLRV